MPQTDKVLQGTQSFLQFGNLEFIDVPCEDARSNVKTQLGIRIKREPTISKHQTYEIYDFIRDSDVRFQVDIGKILLS